MLRRWEAILASTSTTSSVTSSAVRTRFRTSPSDSSRVTMSEWVSVGTRRVMLAFSPPSMVSDATNPPDAAAISLARRTAAPTSSTSTVRSTT
jgi:hypothetical protein